MSTDWLLLALRLIFVIVLYFFLYQIFRVTVRELMALAGDSPPAPRERTPIARLILVDPAESSLAVGLAFAMRPVTAIGRHPESDIVLDDSFVSVDHARLEGVGTTWQLRDLGSTNGTFVNGVRVQRPISIACGDIVQFGRVKLQMVC